MTVENIMSYRLIKLKPTDKICDALLIMHKHQIRNLPVVDDEGQFVGLFGIRRLLTLLLPKAAQIQHGLDELSFMPDEVSALYRRLDKIGQKPVTEYMEKKKNLTFCKPNATFPEVLELLEKNPNTSLPVIIVKGKKKKLVGMVSAWDVLTKLLLNMNTGDSENNEKNVCQITPDEEHIKQVTNEDAETDDQD